MASTTEAGPVVLTACIPAEMKRGLTEAAQANERSVSAELRVALRRHLADKPTLAQTV